MELKVLTLRKSKGTKSFALFADDDLGYDVIAIKSDGTTERFNNVSVVRWEWEGERVDLSSYHWGCGVGRNFQKEYSKVTIKKAEAFEECEIFCPDYIEREAEKE